MWIGCQQPIPPTSEHESFSLNQKFKSYWFDGTAEITSFQLSQNRYGEARQGSAVLIYVTEDFLAKEQVKANQKASNTYPVLKLNRIKNFITGIYPYSIMHSAFTRLGHKNPLVKTTTSIQEWCGQAYMQLNKRQNIAIKSHSYFEGEADQELSIEDVLTEDELWLWIRTQPDQIPLGKMSLLPSFEYLRLQHQPIQPYTAEINKLSTDSITHLQISYPTLERKLTISFESVSPYRIQYWREEQLNFPDRVTEAFRIQSIKLPYWQHNRLEDESLRDSLGLTH